MVSNIIKIKNKYYYISPKEKNEIRDYINSKKKTKVIYNYSTVLKEGVKNIKDK